MRGPSRPWQAAGSPATRVAAPAAIFSAARPPQFLLFDGHGRAVIPWERSPADVEPAVHLSPADLGALSSYLRQHLPAIAASASIDPSDRAWAVHRSLLYEASETFHNISGRVSVTRLTSVLREAARFQHAHAGTFPYVAVIFGTAYSQLTHAVETALYATALAAAAEECDADGLFAIALGGLFADAAKLEFSTAMLMREGPLTGDEWQRMRRHPHRSAEMMRQAGVLTATALRGVLSHHERWDGGGYPQSLRAEQIPFEARCIAIADTFSAMTVDRAHQARVDPYDALLEMSGRPSGQFEPGLLRSFVLTLGAAQGSVVAAARAAPLWARNRDSTAA